VKGCCVLYFPHVADTSDGVWPGAASKSIFRNIFPKLNMRVARSLRFLQGAVYAASHLRCKSMSFPEVRASMLHALDYSSQIVSAPITDIRRQACHDASRVHHPELCPSPETVPQTAANSFFGTL
jgi:hypothetical protein